MFPRGNHRSSAVDDHYMDEDDDYNMEDASSSGTDRDGEVDEEDEEERDDENAEDKEQEEPHALCQLTKMMTSPHSNFARFGGVQGMRTAKLEPSRLQAVNALSMMAGRESNVSGYGRFSSADCCSMAARFLPKEATEVLDKIGSRAYIGQFSEDGALFVAGFQDRRIRIYDCDGGRSWKMRKNVIARNLRWTVTDTALSPDQRFLVYSSITPVVHLVNVGSEHAGIESLAAVTEVHEGLDLASKGSSDATFGLWSVNFSRDGKELLAGSGDDSIYLYDLEANRTAHRIVAHNGDVNCVVFADDSCNMLFSGSDDHLCKVWDRRCSQGQPAGVLQGHLEGITFLDSRKDGRFFISNGKDQCIKLWDIRKMRQAHACPPSKCSSGSFKWDYRWMEYPGLGRDLRHPHDQSIMTYKGHSVLKTLVRCYFSPLHSTGHKYIYTGSHDGCVVIYDLLTGRQAATLKFHHSPVRDCSWHPRLPVLVTSSWDGNLLKWEPSAPVGTAEALLSQLNSAGHAAPYDSD